MINDADHRKAKVFRFKLTINNGIGRQQEFSRSETMALGYTVGSIAKANDIESVTKPHKNQNKRVSCLAKYHTIAGLQSV